MSNQKQKTKIIIFASVLGTLFFLCGCGDFSFYEAVAPGPLPTPTAAPASIFLTPSAVDVVVGGAKVNLDVTSGGNGDITFYLESPAHGSLLGNSGQYQPPAVNVDPEPATDTLMVVDTDGAWGSATITITNP